MCTSSRTASSGRAEMPHSVGECVDGRYRIDRVLGQGGFGETYRALDLSTGQLVVLKVPHISVIGDVSAYNRFRREIEIGHCLDHPGLQRLLPDPHVNGRGEPYIVLEYVDGESLRSYLRTHSPLAIDEVLRIASQLAET